jgi:HD-GYP domain-containing protein (c-di-GMP phosphodiesterase class II)
MSKPQEREFLQGGFDPVADECENVDCPAGFGSIHQFAESLGNAVDAKDPLTFNHSQEVAVFSQELARAMGFSESVVAHIHVAGHLHDIGKIGIPDAILKKRARLSPEELTWIRRHPEIGARIVGPVTAFAAEGGVGDMILHHHEAYDGSGYPFGLRGVEIPIGARIIAVADTLSALMQDRPYRPGTGLELALSEILGCAGSQFDPAVVTALERLKEPLQFVSLLRSRSGKEVSHVYSGDRRDGQAAETLS